MPVEFKDYYTTLGVPRDDDIKKAFRKLARQYHPDVAKDKTAAEEKFKEKSALPVLVDFWAPWCGPCKMVAPELAKVGADGVGRWLVAKVNTDELPDVGARFGIRAIPTLVLLKAGREAARQSGALSAPAILQFLQRSL